MLLRRFVVPVLVLGSAVVLAVAGGCPRRGPAPGPVTFAEHEDAVPPEASETADETDEPQVTDADLPACDFYEYSCGGQYDAVVSRLVDLDGDAVPEWIIGYQCNSFDDLDFPADPAYFTFAKLDAEGQAWREWFNIPAGDGECALDDDSIAAAADLCDDGQVEVVLQMYKFGVSSRPENMYVYRVVGDGVQEASAPCPIETSSDDTMVFWDADDTYPGTELLWARARQGSEAHAAPHRYDIIVFAWVNGLYCEVDSWTTDGTYAEGAAALEEAFGFDVE